MKDFIYGINTSAEILSSAKRRVFRGLIARGAENRAGKIIKALKRRGIRISFENPRHINKIAGGGNHQGVVLEVEPVASLKLHEALGEIGSKKTVWAAVDSITDPMNLGSIIRSCACFGVRKIIVPERRTVGITPAVQKAASGALEKVSVVKVTNLNHAIFELKEHGFWIYGADAGGEDIGKADLAFPALVIIGSEGGGMHRKTREHCDRLVSVPLRGGIESLNASVAAGIILYEASRRACRPGHRRI